jgi:uncharacterized protein YdeI (YjbR/CyaY-like superfamily)
MPPIVNELIVKDRRAWSVWLRREHAKTDAIWLVLARKGVVDPTSLSRAQALEVALCFGWIDGQAKSRDDRTYLQRFTPRRSRSPWSMINVEAATRLIAEGRMQPAGLVEVERARADGRWADAYAGPATIQVPDDLIAALAERPTAAAMFEILTSQNRFSILLQTTTAKRPETRARRIAKFVDMLDRGETPYPQKRGLADLA